MLSRKFPLLLLLLLLLPSLTRAEEPAFRFPGQVSRGEIFRHALPDGLNFFLLPSERGWSVVVSHQENPEKMPVNNFANVTLPLHGINAIQLEGWHFRNADNTGPNDGSPNAPQAERDFTFTTTQADFDRLMEHYQCTLRGPEPCLQLVPLRLGKARLTITSYELEELQTGQQATFKRLEFLVTGSITETDKVIP